MICQYFHYKLSHPALYKAYNLAMKIPLSWKLKYNILTHENFLIILCFAILAFQDL